MNHQIASEKRVFKRSLNDLRGRDLLNLLIEQELLLILHPTDTMIAYKREACYDVAEWRLRETENREENPGQRVSSLRSRIKTALKKTLVPKSPLRQELTTARAMISRLERSIPQHRGESYKNGFAAGVEEAQKRTEK